jgi:hypothetical protein
MRVHVQRMGWLPVLALLLAWLLPPAQAAKPPVKKTIVGKISGSPMGTWMTVTTGPGSASPTSGAASASQLQVDLSSSKITEKGKSLKRYDLVDGMKVRVKGTMRGAALAAEIVEVLGRTAPRK